ncbi:glycoside hydrolase family 3 C-terminal domain-containing protein [Flavihumibacter stibioxidans]|uniref:Beta-1,3-glucosyltransferase n=1 Tax=Flavihumibacter stibioxidans TaxID=1834163 RepID=A0ABR7MAZ6_9BACT|nr:beta-glucosidase [Flavihumibacter stibioxidans]MBC6492014.1 beta-1,3-glucosyltransferase [Flavihumibacter stibioxidans]
MNRLLALTITLFIGASSAHSQSIPPYKNPKLPIETRVKDLLTRMTPEEKFWQLFMIPGDLDKAAPEQYRNGLFGFQVSAASKGDAGGQLLSYNTSEDPLALTRKINAIQKYFVEQTRLGIPVIAFDEALHGLVRDGATAFPQAIALAATWDTTLMGKVAHAIATETKARGIRDILTPVVNIAADPRWGRTEETYGEDPFLSSAMGVSFVGAFERMGIITTPKHFIANVGDGGRDSYPIHMNERLLEEIYLPPFKAAIQKGGSRSIMTSYNSLDGIASSSNHWLLEEKLKKEWGFTGFVISDANAVGGEVVLHNTSKDYAESGKHAISNGMDVIFQTDYNHYKLFQPPFLNGAIDSGRINDAVARVLHAKFELGLFEQPYVTEDLVKELLKNKIHKPLARQAARESFVLLKNAAHTLPLNPDIKSIAVIGAEAIAGRLGGYSGKGNGTVNMLDGIRQRAGKIRVEFAEGAGIQESNWNIVPATALSSGGQPGLKAVYFKNVSLAGPPVLSRQDRELNFSWTLFGPSEETGNNFYSARWTGKISAPETGTFNIGLDGNDGYRLWLDNKLVIDNWRKQSYRTSLTDFNFEKGKSYDIKVEFHEPVANGSIRLIWTAAQPNDRHKKISEAVALAKRSDIAVIVAGIHEGEFQDRAFLSLPGAQEDLIRAVAATGKPVVVLLTGGSAITMSNWLNQVNTVMMAWYPGEEGGHAVADVLFGDYNPAGRLPITFPVHESQLPLVYNHKPTGRGDDYHNLSGQPLFPFGYGLSYTDFEYSDLRMSSASIKATDTLRISFKVRNTGKLAGEEVVQLYVRDLLSSVARPVLELKAFRRLHLQSGEKSQVSFTIGSEELSMLNRELQRVVEPGEFRFLIGSSSRDIRLKGSVIVQE